MLTSLEPFDLGGGSKRKSSSSGSRIQIDNDDHLDALGLGDGRAGSAAIRGRRDRGNKARRRTSLAFNVGSLADDFGEYPSSPSSSSSQTSASPSPPESPAAYQPSLAKDGAKRRSRRSRSRKGSFLTDLPDDIPLGRRKTQEKRQVPSSVSVRETRSQASHPRASSVSASTAKPDEKDDFEDGFNFVEDDFEDIVDNRDNDSDGSEDPLFDDDDLLERIPGARNDGVPSSSQATPSIRSIKSATQSAASSPGKGEPTWQQRIGSDRQRSPEQTRMKAQAPKSPYAGAAATSPNLSPVRCDRSPVQRTKQPTIRPAIETRVETVHPPEQSSIPSAAVVDLSKIEEGVKGLTTMLQKHIYQQSLKEDDEGEKLRAQYEKSILERDALQKRVDELQRTVHQLQSQLATKESASADEVSRIRREYEQKMHQMRMEFDSERESIARDAKVQLEGQLHKANLAREHLAQELALVNSNQKAEIDKLLERERAEREQLERRMRAELASAKKQQEQLESHLRQLFSMEKDELLRQHEEEIRRMQERHDKDVKSIMRHADLEKNMLDLAEKIEATRLQVNETHVHVRNDQNDMIKRREDHVVERESVLRRMETVIGDQQSQLESERSRLQSLYVSFESTMRTVVQSFEEERARLVREQERMEKARELADTEHSRRMEELFEERDKLDRERNQFLAEKGKLSQQLSEERVQLSKERNELLVRKDTQLQEHAEQMHMIAKEREQLNEAKRKLEQDQLYVKERRVVLDNEQQELFDQREKFMQEQAEFKRATEQLTEAAMQVQKDSAVVMEKYQAIAMEREEAESIRREVEQIRQAIEAEKIELHEMQESIQLQRRQLEEERSACNKAHRELNDQRHEVMSKMQQLRAIESKLNEEWTLAAGISSAPTAGFSIFEKHQDGGFDLFETEVHDSSLSSDDSDIVEIGLVNSAVKNKNYCSNRKKREENKKLAERQVKQYHDRQTRARHEAKRDDDDDDEDDNDTVFHKASGSRKRDEPSLSVRPVRQNLARRTARRRSMDYDNDSVVIGDAEAWLSESDTDYSVKSSRRILLEQDRFLRQIVASGHPAPSSTPESGQQVLSHPQTQTLQNQHGQLPEVQLQEQPQDSAAPSATTATATNNNTFETTSTLTHRQSGHTFLPLQALDSTMTMLTSKSHPTPQDT